MKSNEKFTQRAELAIENARLAAGEMGHGYIGTEHLLLGIMMESDGLGARILLRHGIDKAQLWRIVLRANGSGIPGRPEQGLTPRARQAVEQAAQEARQLQQGYIGTEHLLLGLLRDGGNMAVRLLAAAGADPKRLYAAVVRRINETPRTAAKEGNRMLRENESGKRGRGLAEFARDLTAMARMGQLDPVIGRDTEITRAVQILSRRT